MARLKNNGTEVYRLTRENPVEPGDLIDWDRTTIAIMSNGKLLKKRDVNFKADTYNPNGRKHTWGWKVAGKIKQGVDFEKVRDFYLKQNYTLAN